MVQNECSEKFSKFHRKALVLEYLYNKETCKFIKRDSDTGVLLWNLIHYSEHLFCRTTLVSASVLKQNSITAICFQIVIITKIQRFEFNLNSKLRLRLATIRIRSFFSNFLLQFKSEASFSTIYHNWSSELHFPIAFKSPLRNFNYNFLLELNFEVSFPKSHLNLFIHFI